MTTGRINQVAILGHTSGPKVACSDSALSARLRGEARSAWGDSRDPNDKRGGRGQARRLTSVTRNGTATRACGTAEGRLGVHRAAPRARRREGAPKGGLARAVAQSPNTSQTIGGTARCKPPHGSTPLTWAPPARPPKGTRGGSRSEGHRGPAPSRRHGPASRPKEQGSGKAATLPTPSSSSCMQHPGVGVGSAHKARRAVRGPTRVAPSSAPSRATRRTAGDQARRVGRSPAPTRHTRVRDPPYRYKPHKTRDGGRDPAGFLDRIDARARAHRQRGTGPGHDTPFLIAYEAPRPNRARRVS